MFKKVKVLYTNKYQYQKNRMGEIEKVAKKKRQWNNVQKAVLATVGVSGILIIGDIAIKALEFAGGAGRKNFQFNYQTKSALLRLVKKGHIRFVEKGSVRYAEITESGRKSLALESAIAAQKIQSHKRWDKRWRMVIFDIPEKYKGFRNQLRSTIHEIGFLRVQDSVWVFPYECEELLQLLKTDLRVGKFVLYAVVESIENDKVIRNHFKLPAN